MNNILFIQVDLWFSVGFGLRYFAHFIYFVA